MVTKMLTAEHLSYVIVDIQSKIVKEGKVIVFLYILEMLQDMKF